MFGNGVYREYGGVWRDFFSFVLYIRNGLIYYGGVYRYLWVFQKWIFCRVFGRFIYYDTNTHHPYPLSFIDFLLGIFGCFGRFIYQDTTTPPPSVHYFLYRGLNGLFWFIMGGCSRGHSPPFFSIGGYWIVYSAFVCLFRKAYI